MREKLVLAGMFTFICGLYTVTIPSIIYGAELKDISPAPSQAEQKTATKFVKAPNEMEIEYLHPMSFKKRHIDTYSIHILESIGNIHHTDVYRGFTVTRALGSLTDGNEERNSEALGMGYTYLFRKKKKISKKVALAVDASGGLMFYDQAFPVTGRAYNFMWRVGPRVIYMPTAATSLSLGWTYMHVSNGMGSHNPGYNGGGVTLGLGWNF